MLSALIEDDAVRIGDRFSVTFQRALRSPDNGRPYPLQPGLGQLPILKVQDYADHLPPA